MLKKYKRLSDYIKGNRIICIILNSLDVSEILFNLTKQAKQISLIKQIRNNRIIYIIPKYSDVSEILVNLTKQTKQKNLIKQIGTIFGETLAAASIFAIAFAWLMVARGLGWH